MSRRDIPVCPGGRVPSWVLVCLPRIFPRTMSLSALIGGARCPLRRKLKHVYIKIVRPKCTQNLAVIIFCWSQDAVLLCAKGEYLQTHIYVFTIRIVARLTATTAILSRMCRQVWIGTFGICRLHARAPIPMQTNTLGISRCTDRYIRHMQTSAPSLIVRYFPSKFAHTLYKCTPGVRATTPKMTDDAMFLNNRFIFQSPHKVPWRRANTKYGKQKNPWLHNSTFRLKAKNIGSYVTTKYSKQSTATHNKALTKWTPDPMKISSTCQNHVAMSHRSVNDTTMVSCIHRGKTNSLSK